LKSLRIVLVLTAPPLPFGSAAGRWFYVLLRGLTARGHRVTAFAPCRDALEIADAKRIFPEPNYSLRCFEYSRRGYLASKVAAFRRPQSYLHSRELANAVDRELTTPYDVLQLGSQWAGWLALAHRPRTLVNVLDLFRVDCADEQPKGLLNRARFQRMWDAEIKLLRSYEWICTLTSEMSEEVHRISPNSTVHTVPLGMDLDNYLFEPDRITDEPVVTLIGSFDWLPTRKAAFRLLTGLWPAIRQRVPSARLQLVGRNARSVLSGHVDQPGVAIHENVPDILPYFRQANVHLYAPGRASGMKVKALESFAIGLPVVTTKSGVGGIPAIDGVHAGVCEEDAGLIDRCVALLQDKGAQMRQRLAARELVERHCAADTVLDALEMVYENMLAETNRHLVA
jgi:glycosyltransferase involved in cell wall biosynthesis